MAGKIQNEDVKSLSELTGAGGSASQLVNDTKIYVSANSLNKQLSQAITDRDMVAVMTGDSGSGGVKGLVPAPAAGDAAANKFLKANGTWATAGGSSTSLIAMYTTTAGQSIPNSTTTILNYGTLIKDSHSAVTTGASWKFTAPFNGTFRVSASYMFVFGGGWAANEYTEIMIRKNGLSYASHINMQTSTHTANVSNQITHLVQLLATEYLDIRVFQNSGAALGLDTIAGYNRVSIELAGDY